MRLAAGYMSHAFIEQVLLCGNSGLSPLLEAFAWGFDEFSNAVDGSDEENINVMFLGEDGTLEGWDDLREAHIRAVSACMGSSGLNVLQTNTYGLGSLFLRRIFRYILILKN